MNQCLFLIIGIGLFLSSTLWAQTDTIEVSMDGTTYMVFPDSIELVDCILQKTIVDDGVVVLPIEKIGYNTLSLVVDDEEGMQTTNMLVETDKSQYIFIIKYNEDLKKYHHVIKREQAVYNKRPEIKPVDINKKNKVITNAQKDKKVSHNDLTKYCDDLLGIFHGEPIEGTIQHKMVFALTGIYIKNDYLFFILYTENKSNISYDISSVDFSIASKNTTKRRKVEQDEDLIPILERGVPKKIGSPTQYIMVFDKFTLPKDEVLEIRLIEEKGDRDIDIRVGYKEILGAVRI